MIDVVLLGAGNVATHFFKAFTNTEKVTIKQWYNRNLRTIEKYKNQVAITNNLNDLVEADIYILAVSDDAIASLSEELQIGCSHFWKCKFVCYRQETQTWCILSFANLQQKH